MTNQVKLHKKMCHILEDKVHDATLAKNKLIMEVSKRRGMQDRLKKKISELAEENDLQKKTMADVKQRSKQQLLP
eukprot:CAMPEP_0170503428 /NCGR_PEP_ID=MMETSP0208-20121228/44719_1 /TAXON_ID=197538 /ORGANISM="Strombidium inclinatum, Strain S3" /LENGTH=74 /DNA_ID=CAMNT_0010783083 /DNA_START=198 /DNA_END=418 /DNA_ORIENTATION=-